MFPIINDILYKKIGEFIENQDEMEGFSAYMLQRWISMYSTHPIDFLNSTVNIAYRTLDNQQLYKFLLVSLPKYKYKKFNYIKNSLKPDKKRKKEEIELVQVEENRDKLNSSLDFVFGKCE